MKSWLLHNATENYLTQNEGKSAVAEIFIRILGNTIYKHVTAVSKNLCVGEFTMPTTRNTISAWKSKGLTKEGITPLDISGILHLLLYQVLVR